MMNDEDKPIPRRRFFVAGLRELFKPLAGGLENIERVTQELARLDDASAKPKPRTVPLAMWLRPPGALAEQAFRETCSRCGICVSVCPAECIKIDSTGEKGGGAPYIDPQQMPCVVCESLACMHNCPSGALVPTPLADIDMGTAEWHENLCIRTHGQECTACIDQCPLGSAAIELRDGQIHVIEEGCIGCGVCEHYCPTRPASITVVPRAARP
jgi:ferredoxin-type protein NapG